MKHFVAYFKSNIPLALFLGGVVLLAAYQGFLLLSPRIVVLKEDGFHPRVLTVRAGETVTFKSELGKYFWPASDFHPTHTAFPSFDPREPIAPNDSWSFTFETPGVYKYHDHLAAYYFGIIRVTDENGEVLENCMNEGGEFGCWQNEVFFALAEKGVDSAYDAVTLLFNNTPHFAKACHGITHNIGLASYQFYRTDPEFIFSPKAIVCAAGFYHGFMEGYLGASGDIVGSARLCDKIGERLGDETPDARLQCYHGIGHGAVETTIADSGSFGTRDEFVADAIALCEEASVGTQERYRCVSGIYNGIANFYINGAYGLSVEKDDPLHMCGDAKEQYKEACYGNMNSIILAAADNNFSLASARFLTTSDVEHIPKSIEYLASLYAISRMDETSFPSVVSECRTLPGEYRLSCIRGFTNGLLEHGSPGAEYKKALLFCRTPKLTVSERDTCRKAAIANLESWYSVDRARAICSELTGEERTYCVQ